MRNRVSPAWPHVSRTGPADRFSFLARSKPIGPPVEWRSLDMPRLWRFQLHYFDVLREEGRDEATKSRLITDWIENNPIGTSTAWEAYPTSLRVVNWVKYFGEPGPFAVPAVWLESLYLQALWLERNFEYHLLANHLLKNAKALLFAGAFFEGEDARRWLELGSRVLQRELAEQFLDDGGHFERSPMYHAIAIEDLIDCLALIQTWSADFNYEDLARRLQVRVRAGLTFLETILMPDGELPLFNDSVFHESLAPATLLEYGGRIAGRDGAKKVGHTSATALPASGYYVIQDAGDMLIVDCGAPGPRYQPGHSHCDCLSYELALGGKRVIVDTGVFGYEDDPQRRYARGTSAHNTVRVDGHDQMDMWKVFRVARPLSPKGAELRSEPGRTFFTGAHNGFERFSAGLIHRRSIAHQPGRWTFEDVVEGTGSHAMESFIHIAPALSVQCEAARVTVARDGEPIAWIDLDDGIGVEVKAAPYYPAFGVTADATVIVLSLFGSAPLKITYVITTAGS